jgi:ATP-dependent helicase/DNAse subunit B
MFVSRLNLVVERLRSRRNVTGFSDFSLEKTYSYLHPEDPDFRILGKIDLVQTFRESPDVFVSVIDYKTGNNVFRNEDFEKGIDIQLIFYLHLLRESGAIPGMKAAGFYYQPVNPGKLSKDAKKDPLKEKIKMNGMTLNDSRIASAFDPEGDVRGLTRKADGEFTARAKVVDSLQMEHYLRQMQRFIDEAVRMIRNGSFDITPLSATSGSSGSESCQYCPHPGICYLADSKEADSGFETAEGEDD